MSDQWYFTVAGQQRGPVGLAELRGMVQAGSVGPAEHAWVEGMANWAPVSQIPALATGPVRVMPVGGGAMPLPPISTSQTDASGAPLLAYQTPTHLAETPAERAIIAQDDGPFLKIGSSFSTPSGQWIGPVVASPKAFYLLKVSRQQNYAAGGLVGILVSAALTKTDDTRTCRGLDLPIPVRGMLDPKGKKLASDAIILPKEAMNRVKVGGFNNSILAKVGPEKFRMNFMLFKNGKIKRFLTGNGWTINTELQPLVAPVHGVGFGRDASSPPPKRMHPALRVLLIILGIILFIVVVILRVAAG